MKNILIIAEGLIGERFIHHINQKRVADNHYILVTPNTFNLPTKLQIKLEVHHIDPTSYLRVRRLLLKSDFVMAFIALSNIEDSGETLKNIRRVDNKIRVVLLDNWGAFDKLQQNETFVINSNELVANHLYNFLPSVPVVAQNVGLGEGEIMEVLVPFGSTFAYRHVGSIPQIKWKIVAIYRDKKLIMPNNATMIYPQDILLLVGRPQVLINIFNRIHNRAGMFPEPFGRNLYLLLDMDKDEKRALEYIKEVEFLAQKLKGRELLVRVINPGNLEIIETIRELNSKTVDIQVSYSLDMIKNIVTADLQRYDIGLIFVSHQSFNKTEIYKELYEKKKLIYLFGATPLYDIKRSIILMDNDEYMESISSTGFYISETLKLDFCLCDFNPDGDFNKDDKTIEHYETLSHIFHYPIKIDRRQLNPIRAVNAMENILLIAPFSKKLKRRWKIPFLSMSIRDYILDSIKHPKLLIPVEI